MLLKSIAFDQMRWRLLSFRVFSASLYAATAWFVFDHGTYFIAGAESAGDVNRIYLSILNMTLAGALALALASTLTIVGIRWAGLVAFIGCLLQMPWYVNGFADLIIPHLPFVYTRVHVDPRTVRAWWMVGASTAISILMLCRHSRFWKKKDQHR